LLALEPLQRILLGFNAPQELVKLGLCSEEDLHLAQRDEGQ